MSSGKMTEAVKQMVIDKCFPGGWLDGRIVVKIRKIERRVSGFWFWREINESVDLQVEVQDDKGTPIWTSDQICIMRPGENLTITGFQVRLDVNVQLR